MAQEDKTILVVLAPVARQAKKQSLSKSLK